MNLVALTVVLGSVLPVAKEHVATTPTESCVVSWYSVKENGTETASGRPFADEGLTCAHKALPFGTEVLLEHQGNIVKVEVTDRGPYIDGRDFDLSYAAYRQLANPDTGVLRANYLIVAAQEGGS